MNRPDIGACALKQGEVSLMEYKPNGDARWAVVLTPADARNMAQQLLEAADVAEGGKPCPEPAQVPAVQAQAATEPVAQPIRTQCGLPTVQQVERLLLNFMIDSIERLIAIRCDDADWKDADVDVDMAVDLARVHLMRLRADPDSLDGDFELNWWAAASAINLGHKAFSRPDSDYGKTLAGLVSDFRALIELPAFVVNRKGES